jgi:sRNA-binding protein
MATLTLGWRPGDNEKTETTNRPVTGNAVPDTRRRQQMRAAWTVLSRWMDLCPEAFTHPPKPLAIGTHDAIVAATPEVPPAVVHGALRDWTSSHQYQRALASIGAMRVGLDGEVVEAVSAEHQAGAVARLAAMRPKNRR